MNSHTGLKPAYQSQIIRHVLTQKQLVLYFGSEGGRAYCTDHRGTDGDSREAHLEEEQTESAPERGPRRAPRGERAPRRTSEMGVSMTLLSPYFFHSPLEICGAERRQTPQSPDPGPGGGRPSPYRHRRTGPPPRPAGRRAHPAPAPRPAPGSARPAPSPAGQRHKAGQSGAGVPQLTRTAPLRRDEPLTPDPPPYGLYLDGGGRGEVEAPARRKKAASRNQQPQRSRRRHLGRVL